MPSWNAPDPKTHSRGFRFPKAISPILRMGYQKWGFLAFPGNQASSGADSSGDLDGIENGAILHDVKTCHNIKKAQYKRKPPASGTPKAFMDSKTYP